MTATIAEMVARLRHELLQDRGMPYRGIYAEYRTAAGQAISHGSAARIDFDTKVRDTHGCVTTGASWKYTAIATGPHKVYAGILYEATNTWAAGELCELQIYVNDVQYASIDSSSNMVGNGIHARARGSRPVWLNTGDTLSLYTFQGSGATLALFTSALFNWVVICCDRWL